MVDYVYLQGSETVGNAASSMRQSAEEMNRAANNISESLSNFKRFMDDWLQRYQAIVEGRQL